MESRAKVLAHSAHPILIAYPLGLLSTATVFDWFAIPARTRAKQVGLWHGLGNVLVLVLFAVSWLLRTGSPQAPPTFAIVLAIAGTAVVFFTGWLGGELIHRLGVSVDDGANLDASNSLSGRSAAESAAGAMRRGT
jgi:uncharacterized membrane protein